MCRAGERTVNAAVGFVRGACVPPVKKNYGNTLPAPVRSLEKRILELKLKFPGQS